MLVNAFKYESKLILLSLGELGSSALWGVVEVCLFYLKDQNLLDEFSFPWLKQA